jgi:hypothetical protein
MTDQEIRNLAYANGFISQWTRPGFGPDLHDHVFAFARAILAAAPVAPTWTAIADEKPPTMQDVLFAGEHEGKPVIHIGYLSWRDNLYVILTVGRWTPTHWMHLPQPPK